MLSLLCIHMHPESHFGLQVRARYARARTRKRAPDTPVDMWDWCRADGAGSGTFFPERPPSCALHALIETCGCDGFGVLSASIVYAVGISSTRQSNCVDSIVFDTLRAEQRLLRHTHCPRPAQYTAVGRARAPASAWRAVRTRAGPQRPRPTFFAALFYSTARTGAQRPIWHGTSPSALATCPQRGIALVTAL